MQRQASRLVALLEQMAHVGIYQQVEQLRLRVLHTQIVQLLLEELRWQLARLGEVPAFQMEPHVFLKHLVQGI